jgi:LacI family transcriptional regulator
MRPRFAITEESVPNGKEATLSKIARKAHVSISTVSRVLNFEPTVSDASRKKVEEVVKLHGYERKLSRRNLSRLIAIICPDIANPYFPLLIKGAENVVKTHGSNLILCDSEDDARVAEQHVESSLRIGVSGIIFIATTGDNRCIARAVEARIPVVSLDRKVQVENVSYVGSDNRSGAYQAVRYLLDLGHERIVYMSGPHDISTEPERFEGYKSALQRNNVPVDNRLLLSSDYHMESAYASMNRFLDLKPDFTAVFATNDLMALGAKQALEEHGLRIPEDVSIAGFDDIPVSGVVRLTTVATPTYEMGKNAALLLGDLIEGRKVAPQTIILQPSLRIRNSCQKRVNAR